MGEKPSPEWAARFYHVAEEFARGKDDEEDNPVGWQEVRLNIIGTKDYDPSLPNVIKWNTKHNRPAGDILSYVDNLRTAGATLEEAWAIARLIASRLQYLGIQDAPRKRRVDGNGPWTGTIFDTSNNKISKTVAVEKWEKAKRYIDQMVETANSENPEFEFKFLEKARGFLCHLAMTFPILFPYLKGMHLTLCSHLKYRDEEGWKMKELLWIGWLSSRVEKGIITEEEMNHLINDDTSDPPKVVKPVPRFYSCLKALEKCFAPDTPPVEVDRVENYLLLLYGFMDASKAGLGSIMASEKGMNYRVGTWGADTGGESSNWREFENLVINLEKEAKEGRLKGTKVVLTTDNQVTESCLYKGNSSSEKLFDLVVRLRTLEMHEGASILVTHVSGKRMMKQGTDGLSRGSFHLGSATGKSILDFCPWAIKPLDANPHLESWIRSVVGKEAEVLNTEDWFRRAHDWNGGYYDRKGFWRKCYKPGHFIWNIPAGAADVALEELRKARMKRRHSYHFLLIPALCTPMWLKKFHKECDFIAIIPPTQTYWSANECEPLYLGICFPFISCFPWKLQRTPKLFELDRSLRQLWKADNMDAGDFLRKLLQFVQRVQCVSPSVVQSMLFFEPAAPVSCTKTQV